MSSFPLPDNSGITSSPEKLRQTEQSTVPFSPITYRGKESVGPEPGLQVILEQAMEKTVATGAAIALRIDNAVSCQASTGAPAPEVGARLPAGISLTELCLGTGEILLCNDTNTDRRVDPRLCKEMGIRSVLVSPIKRNARVVGVLEVVSTRPNAFKQDDLTTISKLADQVLPFLSESATIDVLKEHDSLASTDAAEAPEWNGHYLGSQLSDQPTMRKQEPSSGARWLTTGLATALALAVILGYGYHFKNSRVAKHAATLPIVAANHKSATPTQDVVSEQDKEITGQTKALASVLTATRQEVILAIREAVQATDVNRILNRAEAGDSTAQYEMALRYADGEGVPQNYRNAMSWFARAAANGNDNAEWKLGLGYIKGIGVHHDERQAAVWFKRAANQGDVQAQGALSDLYLSGRGVPRDYVRAYTWASIAAGLRGNESDRLSVLESRMTEAQMVDARRRISIWWERQRRTVAIPASSQRTDR
jgi:hypothetical protein